MIKKKKKIVVFIATAIFLVLAFIFWLNMEDELYLIRIADDIHLGYEKSYYNTPRKQILYFGTIKYNKLTKKIDLRRIAISNISWVFKEHVLNEYINSKRIRVSLREWQELFDSLNNISHYETYWIININSDIFNSKCNVNLPYVITNEELIRYLYKYSLESKTDLGIIGDIFNDPSHLFIRFKNSFNKLPKIDCPISDVK